MKKLKWIIPLCLVILIAIGALSLVLRYRSAGETQLQLFGDKALYQIREKGVKTTKLPGDYSSFDRFVSSPNGRYIAILFRDEDGSLAQVIDTRQPRKPLLELDAYMQNLFLADDGTLIYSSGVQLFRADLTGRQPLEGTTGAKDFTANADCSRLYFFTSSEDGRYSLWEYDLKTDARTMLLEGADRLFLSLCQTADGQNIVCAAQAVILTGTAYDQVLDPYPTVHNPLREQLQARTVRQTTRTVYRWVDGKREILAEGVVGEFFCDPLSGTVVHTTATLVQPVVELSELSDASIPPRQVWYCSVGGTRWVMPALQDLSTLSFSLCFTPEGDVLASCPLYLYRWSPRNDCLLEEKLGLKPEAFTAVRAADGTDVVYTMTESGKLYRLDEDGEQLIAEDVCRFYLPCVQLPDGTKQQIDELVYLHRYYDPGTGETYPMRRYDARDFLLSVWEAGQEEPLLHVADGDPQAVAVLPDGSLVANVPGTAWVIGPGRVERLSSRLPGTALGNTCMVTLGNPYIIYGYQ